MLPLFIDIFCVLFPLDFLQFIPVKYIMLIIEVLTILVVAISNGVKNW